MPANEVVNRGHGPLLLRLANLNLTPLTAAPAKAIHRRQRNTDDGTQQHSHQHGAYHNAADAGGLNFLQPRFVNFNRLVHRKWKLAN